MKKTKRLTALVAAIAMLASMVCFTATASAEETTGFVSVSDEDVALGVKLEVLGVITNEFEMSQYVTRGQMASIAANYAKIPASASKQVFPDVAPEHPYYGAIGALYNLGVVSGDENGNFNPDRLVTYDEALVYIINAVGHKPFATREGGYPTGYHRIAIKHDMLSDLSMKKGTDKATLADIYKMIDKSLTAAVVVSSYYGDGDIIYTLSETETFLSDVYKIKQYRGIITGIPGTRLTALADDIKKDQIEINGKRYDLYGYPEFSMLGYSVDFYVSTEEPDVILHIEETKKANTILRVDSVDLLKAKSTDTRVYYSDEKDKEYHFDLVSNFSMIYNNQYYDMYGVLSRILPDNGYIEALDNNRDGVYDVLYIFTYRNVMVANISSDGSTVRDAITNASEDLSDDDQVINVYFGNSRNLTTGSIQAGDVLSIVESKQSPVIKTVYISRDLVMGKIESSDSELGYQINGEWYRAAVDYNYSKEPLTLGKEGAFYLDMNGDIAYYERDMSNRSHTAAIINGLDYELGNFESKIGIRVYTEKGEIDFIYLNEKVKVNDVKYDLTDRSDATTVLNTIGDAVMGGGYTLNKAYAVTYLVNDKGYISELYTGRSVNDDYGPGKLNTVFSSETTATFHKNAIDIIRCVGGGELTMQLLNPKNSWVVAIPTAENIEEFDDYKKFSITDNYAYGPEGSVNAEYVLAEGFDIYTFKETTHHMADIVVFRGVGGGSNDVPHSNDIDVITDIGTASTKDGEITPKLYMAKTSYALAAEVRLPVVNAEGKVEYQTMSSSELIDADGYVGELNEAVKLKKGMVVQYTLNKNSEIQALRIIAESAKDGSGNVSVRPLYKKSTTSHYLMNNYTGVSGGGNVFMGTVTEDGYDVESTQLRFYVPDVADSYYLHYSSDDVIIYDIDTNKARIGSSVDIMSGSVFVSNITHFYSGKTLIIFE